MKQVWLAAFAAVGFTVAAWGQLAVTPCPQSTDTNSWWWKRFEQKQALVKAGGWKVVFLGDSITHFWEDRGKAQWEKYFAGEAYRALDLGFSADRTEHVLWRIDHGEFDGYSAKAIVLMIGTNNSGHRLGIETAADTVIGIHLILDRLQKKQPDATIILLPIFPRGETPSDACRVRNEAVNAGIKGLADGKKIVWCDFNDQFLTADGTLTKEIMPDRLHPAAIGYEIWARNVKPLIDAALGLTPKEEPETVKPLAGFGGRSLWRLNRLAEKRAQICADQDHAFDVVFFGDSITHFWETHGTNTFKKYFAGRYDILNLGYGGDHIQHLVWRGLNGELDGYKTKLVMLMIGTNNHPDSPEEIALGIRKLLDIIAQKQPQAQTLLLPILPRGNPQDYAKNLKANALIQKFADNQKVLWVDFTAKFLKPDGSINESLYAEKLPRATHPNEAGYVIWAESVLPYFKAACGK